MSQYHKHKFWIHDPINITPKLISYIIGLPATGYSMPTMSNNYSLLKELTERKASKKSKVVMINQIHNLVVKWKNIIVSVFLKNLGHPSNVKQEMLEEIKNIA